MRVRRPYVSRSPLANHLLINGVLDGVCHDLRLIDHGVMHSLVKQLLELHGVLGDGDVMR